MVGVHDIKEEIEHGEAYQGAFLDIDGVRIERTKKHSLESILYIVLCGTMAGVDSWIGFQDYADHHVEVLKIFIDFPQGVPSHDAFARVLERLDVEASAECFEGLASKKSYDTKKEVTARHIVSA